MLDFVCMYRLQLEGGSKLNMIFCVTWECCVRWNLQMREIWKVFFFSASGMQIVDLKEEDDMKGKYIRQCGMFANVLV